MARPSRAADRRVETSSSALRYWPKRPAQGTLQGTSALRRTYSCACQRQNQQGSECSHATSLPGELPALYSSWGCRACRCEFQPYYYRFHRRTSLLDGMREILHLARAVAHSAWNHAGCPVVGAHREKVSAAEQRDAQGL